MRLTEWMPEGEPVLTPQGCVLPREWVKGEIKRIQNHGGEALISVKRGKISINLISRGKGFEEITQYDTVRKVRNEHH